MYRHNFHYNVLLISRTNATTGTLRDKSSATTYLPVRPVAPATATRVVGDCEEEDDDDEDEEVSSELLEAKTSVGE